MIPPSRLQGTLRPRSLSTPSLPSHQARTFFTWKRSTLPTWEAHSDPVYNRCNRYRTLKTRAKLLQNLRRRSQYYWDADAKPFFTPKHIRYASHWQLGGRPPRWTKQGKEEGEKEEKEEKDGYELSRRERLWKEQMEAMRRRIESDPYEAVFGKRFEPFWGPLVPTWMREEMGLPKEGEVTAKKQEQRKEKEPAKKVEGQPKAPERKDSGAYAYSSSTSWDSKTNQAEKTEWDSVSGKTSHYAYDPVSGRMMPVDPPKTASGDNSKALTKEASKAIASEEKYGAGKLKAPEKTPGESRKAIPIPSQTQDSSYDTRPRARMYDSSKEQGLDSLTPTSIRASVGKKKPPTIPEHIPMPSKSTDSIEQQLKNFDASSQRLRGQIAGIVDHATTVPFFDEPVPSQSRGAERLQPAVERMQSKSAPVPAEQEFDDAAVHEATEPLGSRTKPFVPQSWDNQAELLQDARVQRRSETSKPDLDARRSRDEKGGDYPSRQSAENSVQSPLSSLESVNADLKREVEAQKERYVSKIRDLRSELDTAYKQSSVHADEFRDQIGKLEKRLVSAQKGVDEAGLKSTEQRYRDKVRDLKAELDRAYKQSAVHADEFTHRIKGLEAELAQSSTGRIDGSGAGSKSAAAPNDPEPLKAMQGEGDFCTNVTKFADSGKWYKQPTTLPLIPNGAVEAAEKELRDDPAIDSYAQNETSGQYQFTPDGLDNEVNGKSCGDALQGNAAKKAAKNVKKAEVPVSEAEEPFVRNEVAGQYAFHPEEADRLGTELRSKSCGDALQGNAAKKAAKVAKKAQVPVSEGEEPFVRNEVAGQYTFHPEEEARLGSELQGKSCGDILQGNAVAKAKGKATATPAADTKDPSRFAGLQDYQIQPSLLEESNRKRMEIARQEAEASEWSWGWPWGSKGREMGGGEPQFGSDEYEAASGGRKRASAPGFENDGLEAEVKNKGKEEREYASDAYEAAATRGKAQGRVEGGVWHENDTLEQGKTKTAPAGKSSVKNNSLEQELKRKALQQAAYASDEYEAAVSAGKRAGKAFHENDGLEQELKRKGKEPREYASDAYITAAKAKSAEKGQKSDLEAELKQKAKQQRAYTSDEYHAAASAQTAKTTSSNLEAELKAKGKQQPAYASDDYEAACDREASTAFHENESLEDELRAKGKQQPAYASDEYEAATKGRKERADGKKIQASTTLPKESLEAELKRKSGEKAAYASDDYAMAAAAPTPTPKAPNSPLKTPARWHEPSHYEIVTLSPKGHLTTTPALANTDTPMRAPVDAPFSSHRETLRTLAPEWNGDFEIERALPLPSALAALSQPQRFLSSFASFANRGFAPVHAHQNVVVFRLQSDAVRLAEGTLPKGRESGMRNPVDGMKKADKWGGAVTGNYASPTGFVNFDTSAETGDGEGGQRVRREEAVYSGARLSRPASDGTAGKGAQQVYSGRAARLQRREARRAERRNRRWAGVLGLAGVGVAGTVYAAGSLEDRVQRQRVGGSEGREGVGRGTKWVLDGGEWKR